MDAPPDQRAEPRPDDWWRYSVRRSMGQRSVVAEWYQEKPGGLDLLMNWYVLAPMPTLEEVYKQCQGDLPGLYRTLKAMVMKFGMDLTDARMTPLRDVLVYLESSRGIPRAIEVQKAKYVGRGGL